MQNFNQSLKELSGLMTHINLRGNGFFKDEQSQKAFFCILRDLPESIACLDLSDNDLEIQNKDTLSKLFNLLPPSIKITLNHEEPLSKDNQTQRHDWPKEYFNYLAKANTALELSRAVLNGYVKGDTPLGQTFFFHFFRHHIAEVERLLYYIDHGLITDLEDLHLEAEQIKPSNSIGSLSKRLCFLNTPHKVSREIQIINEEDLEVIELKCLQFK